MEGSAFLSERTQRPVKSMESVDVYTALFLASEEDALKRVLDDPQIWWLFFSRVG